MSTVTRNLWMERRGELADAYIRSAGTLRFELVTRAIVQELGNQPCRILDIGGGYGKQAIMLASLGHKTVVLDCDPNMVAIAEQRLLQEPEAVRQRVTLVVGDGADAAALVGGGFDAVCSHSVVMYQSDPTQHLSALVDAVESGGLVSIMSINPDAIAMRSGLQGRWHEALSTLQNGFESHDSYPEIVRGHSRRTVGNFLEAHDVPIVSWHGIGIFTDHIMGKIVVDDPEEVYLTEWLAGHREPYRQVARCYHILARKT